MPEGQSHRTCTHLVKQYRGMKINRYVVGITAFCNNMHMHAHRQQQSGFFLKTLWHYVTEENMMFRKNTQEYN